MQLKAFMCWNNPDLRNQQLASNRAEQERPTHTPLRLKTQL